METLTPDQYPASPSQMTDAERQWMIELNQLGVQQNAPGFPMHAAVFEWNDFLDDCRAGCTPLEAITRCKASYAK